MESAPDDEPSSEADGRWPSSRLVPLAIIVMAGAVIAVLLLSARGAQDAGLATLRAGSVAEGSLPVTLPIRYAAGQLAVEARLGDDETSLPMLLDSGSPTLIADSLAAVHAGDPSGTVSAMAMDGQVISSPVVSLRRVRIGAADFRDVGAVETAIDRDDPLWCLADAGIIGASLMQDAVWQLDYEAQRLTIAPSVDGLDHVDSAIRLDFTPASDASPSPLVSLPAGDGTLTFLVDTGSDGWLTVHPADLSRTGVELAPGAPTVATLASSAGGRIATRLTWTAADLTLGQRQLADVPLATTAALPEGRGIMGNAFLDDFVVTIDWTDDALYLDPVSDDPGPEVPRSVSPTWHDGFVVGSVVEGAPGTTDIQLDTPILAIDGEDVSRATVDDACRRLTDASHPPTSITLAGDVPVDVEVGPVSGFLDALKASGPGSSPDPGLGSGG